MTLAETSMTSVNNLYDRNLADTHSGSVLHIDSHPEDQKENYHETIKIIDEKIATANSDVPSSSKKLCGCSASTIKVMTGIVIVILIAMSSTGATQTGKSVFSNNFRAPFFTTWVSTCFMAITYPVFMISLLFKKSAFRLRSFLQKSELLFGSQGFCVQRLFYFSLRYTLPFCVLWLLTNYLYYLSLEKLLPGTTTAVFSSSSCFVYIFSLIFLKDSFYVIRLISILLSIGGIVVFSYTLGFGSVNTYGILYIVLSSIGAASYQVSFKRVIGSPSGCQVALFLTVLGSLCFLLFWPVVLIIAYYEYEVIEFSKIPWGFLIGTSLFGVVFNFLINFGISLTFPLFISIGALLGIPFNAVVDALFRGSKFGIYEIGAFLLIIFGFILMLIPNNILEKYEKKLFCKYSSLRQRRKTDSLSMPD
ncbi:solute carrier family 35 member F4 isoform X1 [Hydra vulgaris]